MTHNFVLGCFESLWHYGLPSSPPPTASQIISFSSTPSIFTPTSSCSTSSSCPVADKAMFASQADSLRSLFTVLDEDGDGRISLRELSSLLAKLGINSTHSDNLLLSLAVHSTLNHQQTSSTHIDDLPSLDFPQFAQLYAALFNAASQDGPTPTDDGIEDELLDAFQVYDTNRDGFISAVELAAVLLELGLLPHHRGVDAHLGTCQAYIESVDLDGNGMVDLQEFKAMMNMHSNIAPTSSRSTCFSMPQYIVGS